MTSWHEKNEERSRERAIKPDKTRTGRKETTIKRGGREGGAEHDTGDGCPRGQE